MKKNILLTEQQLDDLLKNIFGSLGDDKSDKTEKDGGILSSLFGGLGKKSSDDSKDTEKTTKSKTTTNPPAKTSSSDFDEIVKKVIDNLEGGYYHPDMLKDGRVKDGRYGNSGETMFGIDRKAGGDINTTSAGNEFWGIIDKANARSSWKWNYMGGPLESKLKSIVPQMIKPLYDKNSNLYLTPQSREIVNSNPGLLFNFIYATWNGPGWFKKFASEINKKVANGVTDPKELLKSAIDVRRNSGNSLVSQGAKKIENITNTLA